MRHWVVTFPWSLRFQLARDPALCRAVRRTFLRAVFGGYQRRAARVGLVGARTGAVNVARESDTESGQGPDRGGSRGTISGGPGPGREKNRMS